MDLVLDGKSLGLEALDDVAEGRVRRLSLSADACERVNRARLVVEEKLASGAVHYGLNTGFGRLASVRVSASKLRALQENVVRSHAAGVGAPLSETEVRVLLALRANTLATGFSGCRLEVVLRLCDLYNAGILPVIPEKGSLGASGDLAPLAHLALVLIGEGEAFLGDERIPGAEALRRAGLSALVLEPKDGISLINGTQVSTALAVHACLRLRRLADEADVIAAMTAEALLSTDAAFDARVMAVRPHPGQALVAKRLKALMAESALRESHRDCGKVQDAYSIRCTPQVQGAVRDALAHVEDVVSRELNAATDNPLVFAATGPTSACGGAFCALPGSIERPVCGEVADGDLVSGGNFHGEPIALALDYLAIAASELGGLSERRIERLVNPDYSDLPPFLVAEEGLNSGFMMAHVTAVSLVAENKVLAHPASVDSLPTSAGQEDHVSMSQTAALKLRQILDNVENILAIEALAAAQGLDFRRPLLPSPSLQRAHACVREIVLFLDRDRVLAPDIAAMRDRLRGGKLFDAAGLEFTDPGGGTRSPKNGG